MKILVMLLSIPISRVIEKVVTKAWRAARPGDPATDANNPTAKAADAIGYAALTAAAGVAAQLLTRKASEKSYEKLMGQPPPPPPPSKAEKKAAKKADK
jgi:hypothetical protein